MIAKLGDQTAGQQSAVRFLVERARADDNGDRRGSQRFPFFRPVIIQAKLQRPIGLSAFSRDISYSGIGLILFWPLEVGPVELTIHVGDDEEVVVAGHVRWCQACGQGWYAAGIGFDEQLPG